MRCTFKNRLSAYEVFKLALSNIAKFFAALMMSCALVKQTSFKLRCNFKITQAVTTHLSELLGYTYTALKNLLPAVKPVLENRVEGAYGHKM
jgi:hypothetical protein